MTADELRDALIDFGTTLATERRQRQASLATVSRESGVPQWSIQRIERGAPYTSTTALKLLGWMDTPDPDSTCDRCGIRGHGLMCRDCRDVIRDEEGHG